jgi:hypothetical protein
VGDYKCTKIFFGSTEEKEYMGDIEVDGRIVLSEV